MLAPTLPAGGAQTLQPWAEAADRETGYRVTMIDSRGVVLADSRHDPETMENHARRPEVAAALGGRTGPTCGGAPRWISTFPISRSRSAVPGGAAAVLRLAVPLERVGASIAAVRGLILRASAFAMLIALLIAYFIARVPHPADSPH